MIVNAEFFDENPMENVVTSLHYKVDKTLFFGYERMLKRNKRCVEKFLKEICGVQEVEFCVVDEVDLWEITDTIQKAVSREHALGHYVFFDLTGGESLPLVAFGMVSKQLTAFMHKYDIQQGKMYEYGCEGCPLLSELAQYAPISLNLDAYISLYGGTINYRMHKDYKDAWSSGNPKTVLEMWNLSRAYKDQWLHYSALLPSINFLMPAKGKGFLRMSVMKMVFTATPIRMRQ